MGEEGKNEKVGETQRRGRSKQTEVDVKLSSKNEPFRETVFAM